MQPGDPNRPRDPNDVSAVPDILRKQSSEPPPVSGEVGDFRQGTPLSQWALARYLIGRALIEAIGWTLLLVAGGLLALAAVSEWVVHSTGPAVLLVVLAVGVLLMRWVLLAIMRRLTGFERFGPLEGRMQALVNDTSSDVLRELRRVGLPGRLWTLPLLLFAFFGRERRARTLTKMRRFETGNAVPKARLDELFLLMSEALQGGRAAGGPARGRRR